jgi:hypothetical protein
MIDSNRQKNDHGNGCEVGGYLPDHSLILAGTVHG